MTLSPTLREEVRLNTATAHRELESTPLMHAVSEGSPSDSEYRDYLAGHLCLYAPLEAALRPWVPSSWRAARLIKSQWLREDLIALGDDARPGNTDPAPITSEAQALGTLYLLEGATLGLQVVRRRIDAGSARRGAASRFMHGYGDATGANWREFVVHLETLPRSVWPQALVAASATFAAFQRHFAGPRAPTAARKDAALPLSSISPAGDRLRPALGRSS